MLERVGMQWNCKCYEAVTLSGHSQGYMPWKSWHVDNHVQSIQQTGYACTSLLVSECNFDRVYQSCCVVCCWAKSGTILEYS